MCECKVGPGKFEGESALTYLAWQAVGISASDETTGGGDDGYGGEPTTDWIEAPLDLDNADAIAAAREYGYCDACIEEASGPHPYGIRGGIAVWESDQGFVNMTTFDTANEYHRALSSAQDDDGAAESEESE